MKNKCTCNELPNCNDHQEWCEITVQRKKRNARANYLRRERESILRDCGLTKVRGSVSGKIYWE